MVRCRWRGKSPRPARGCRGATKRPSVDGCRESRNPPRVIQRQGVDHGSREHGGLLSGDETANVYWRGDGSMPEPRHGWGCNGGAAPLAKIARVLPPQTSCGSRGAPVFCFLLGPALTMKDSWRGVSTCARWHAAIRFCESMH
jgi:hypothetical protein